MPYLTYDEFKNITGADMDEITFNVLLQKASAVLDNVTNHFYQRVDMEKDNPWRVAQFKKALSVQIEYFHETGATTYEGINKVPKSFSVGRTSVSYDSKGESKSLVAEDIFIYLEGTGLLYRGVSVW